MSRILADREIKSLIGNCIRDADIARLNPNGIELRLGRKIRFLSTGEEFDLDDGAFVKIGPGESVIIASFESLDFSKGTVQNIFPSCMLMAWINPTTTMMREGIMQVATKVDAGFVGKLNWGLRNSSFKDLILQFGEPVFKLTLVLLEGNEVPEQSYGDRSGDRYQGTDGIMLSSRRIPADIPRKKLVTSGREKLDPKIILKEAGHPFDQIGTELVQLQGKFEMVSKDVALLKENFETRTKELSAKIESETAAVLGRMDQAKEGIKDHVEHVFSNKFLLMTGTLVGAFVAVVGLWSAIESQLTTAGKIISAAGGGAAICLIVFAISRREPHRKS